jgi:hypothetical protein
MIDQPDSAADRILTDRGKAPVAPSIVQAEDMYRPTLVLGLGGTGTLVLKRLKRLIEEKFGDEHTELFQLLALDTELETLDYYQRLEVSEFMNLAETTILGDDIVRAMIDPDREHIYKGLRAWWPTRADGREPFLPGDITSGAKATRCVGRMALWYRSMEIYRVIERKFDNALQIRGLRRTETPATGNAAKVFIVCSLAGGTGSGMFLDIAYMVRQILDKIGMTSFITGLLVADATLFAKIINEEGLLRRMQANIYAALCELDWFMGGYEGAKQKIIRSPFLYDMRFLSQLRIRSSAKPFDVCYLVTAMNEHGRRLRRLEDLTEMMAQEIFLEIATPLGRTGRSALDNVERLSHFSEYGPRPLAYSSFAVSSLNLNPDLVSDQCTLNLARQTLKWLINPNTDKPLSLPRQVTEQLHELPLDTDGAAEVLIQYMDDNPNSRLPKLEFPSGIEGGQFASRAKSLRNDLEYMLEDYIRPAYRDAENILAERYQRNLDRIVLGLLSSGQASLLQIAKLTEEWLARVEAAREEMAAERSAAHQEIDGATQNADDALTRLEEAIVSPEHRLLLVTTHKQRRITGAAQDFLGALEGWGGSLLDGYRWQTLASVFEQVSLNLRQYRDNLCRLRDRLEITHRRVLERQQATKVNIEQGSNQYQLEFEVLGTSDVEVLATYFEHQIEPESVAKAVLDELELLRTGSGQDRLLGAKIIEYLDSCVRAEIRAKGLFEILNLIHEDSEAGIERQLKKLIEYAAPFWHLSLTNCPESTEWSVISLVGYAGASSANSGSYFEEVLRRVMDRYTTVDIAEPNRVIFLNTKHGVPSFALSATQGMMRSAYYYYKRGWLDNQPGFRPVHISQEWMDQHDLDPAPEPD